MWKCPSCCSYNHPCIERDTTSIKKLLFPSEKIPVTSGHQYPSIKCGSSKQFPSSTKHIFAENFCWKLLCTSPCKFHCAQDFQNSKCQAGFEAIQKTAYELSDVPAKGTHGNSVYIRMWALLCCIQNISKSSCEKKQGSLKILCTLRNVSWYRSLWCGYPCWLSVQAAVLLPLQKLYKNESWYALHL